MESLFKFIMIRPPEALKPQTDSVPLVASQGIVDRVNRALSSNENSAINLRNLSKEYLQSQDAIVDANGDPLIQKAVKFSHLITDTMNVADARDKAQQLFGSPLSDVVNTTNFDKITQRLSDTLVALKYLGQTDGRTDDLSAAYRALAYIKLLVNVSDDKSILPPSVFFALTITISGIDRPVKPTPKPVNGPAEGGVGDSSLPNRNKRDELKSKVDALQNTINELTNLPASQLTVPTPLASSGNTGHEKSAGSAKITSPVAVNRREISNNKLESLVSTAISDTAEMKLVGSDAPLRMIAEKDVIRQLPSFAQKTLKDEGVSLDKLNLTHAVNTLSRSLRESSTELAVMDYQSSQQTMLYKIGSNLYEISDIINIKDKFPHQPFVVVPTTHGDLKPVGIGDLLVVKQALKRYDAYDLADVINVMKNEHRSTETKRTQSETTTTSVETTVTQEEEKDQQTTERFEMQTESSNVQKTDESLKLGASISASYGPAVTFKASADYGLNNSKEQSSKVATNYSKEVTNKASSKITQTIKKLVSTTYVQTFLEDNVHEWNNVGGTAHVIGQYQWLDKIYEAQVFNYGKRLLFDTTVSEPAAFLYYATIKQPAAGSNLIKPVPFTLTPDQINEGNFAYYVQQYNAAGVQAPPPPYSTVSKTFDGADDRSDRGEFTKTAELPLPAGYKAVASSVYVSFNYWDAGSASVDIALGSVSHRWMNATGIGFWNASLNEETVSIPFVLKTFRIAMATASVEIQCARTDTALETWRLATHEAIKQGYEKMLRDYNDALAAAQNQAASEVHGANPDANAIAIREEMKRLMITLFTNQQFDIFGSIASGPFGYPQMDISVAEAQGAYVRFFEEAFEWEQMMYVFYPYFWARKQLWSQRVLFSDNDPQFQAFLKAGAARVVVSVRPGFELAVAHFMETGQIWNGGNPPTITDPDYLSIVDEIKSQEGAPQGEVAQGDPWDVRVPTRLIKLRTVDTLPEWKKDVNGTWISAN